MVILLFGVTCVGKTAVGQKLAEKLNYQFFDMDQVIKEKLATTIDHFMAENPFAYERSKLKGKMLKELIEEHRDNLVIAVSPIHFSRFFNPLFKREGIIPIELQDTPEHIFQRLIFADADDNIYEDEPYKLAHQARLMREIREEIREKTPTFKKIVNKYFIDNKPVEAVAADLAERLQAIAQRQPSE